MSELAGLKLLDKNKIILSVSQWQVFCDILDRIAKTNPKLKLNISMFEKEGTTG